MNTWAQIRYLSRSEGLSGRKIAARLKVSRHTVAKALAQDCPPTYSPRPPVDSAWTRIQPAVIGLLKQYPTMPCSVISERIGWEGSPSWLRENVAKLRVDYVPVDPVDRLVHRPGVQVQCDLWFPDVDIPTGDGLAARFPVLVMVACYARFITGLMIPSRQTMDILAGMWSIIRDDIGGIPNRFLWDNEAGIGQRGKLTDPAACWAGVLGATIVQTKPYDPETKGVVERANQFLETSFLPGREFDGPGDFNYQLHQWLTQHGNRRKVRAIKARPMELITSEREAMNPLPPIPPDVVDVWPIRINRDYHVRIKSNDYSVCPTMIGRIVNVHISIDRVWMTHQRMIVAEHQRSWAQATTITDPTHVLTASRLRTHYQTPQSPPVDDTISLSRDLSVYDTAFGVDLTNEPTMSTTELVVA